MVIFVTDIGRHWNHNNPILEQYADCVVVVCFSGKKVTDKYRCVVVESKPDGILGMATPNKQPEMINKQNQEFINDKKLKIPDFLKN